MWLIDAAGDAAMLVRLGRTIDPELLGQVLALERALNSSGHPGLTGTVASYASLLCRFDPKATDARSVEALVKSFEGKLEEVDLAGDLLELPTRYDGPDLTAVAAHTGLSHRAIVQLHTSREYLVYCVGFAPGFTYCGVLDDRLATPRKSVPSPRVEPGSVAIAGVQTGVYAVASPGGWNVIGHTDVPLFDVGADPPVRVKPGDRIRFVSR